MEAKEEVKQHHLKGRKSNNRAGQNKWTKLAQANSPEAKRQLERWRERYQSGAIMDKLAEIANGEVKANPLQIKAYELILDRLEPRLSAVEQTTVDPGRSEADIMQELRQAIEADPSFKTQLQALIDGRPVEVSTNKGDTQNPGQPDSQPISKTGS